jgi:hypothetical protein
LDVRNPRIAHVVADVTSATPQEWIPMALGQHAPEDQESGSASTYSSLKASIRAYRGLISPIIVTPQDDGFYVVIEGNTRVAIFRELADEGSPGNWETIPAIVQADLEEEGEHAIRLQGFCRKVGFLLRLPNTNPLNITRLLVSTSAINRTLRQNPPLCLAQGRDPTKPSLKCCQVHGGPLVARAIIVDTNKSRHKILELPHGCQRIVLTVSRRREVKKAS